MRITSLIVSFFLLAVVPAHGIAQDTTGQAIETIPQTSPAQQTPPASDIPPHTNLVDRFLKDQGHIWTSPLHIKRGDVKWLLPLGAGAAALLATDQKLSDDVRSNSSLRSPSKFLSNFGGTLPMAAASGALLGIGKLTGNEKAARTGKLATEAVLHSALVVQGLKLAFERERPDKIGGQGSFWGGGQSFPSGHAATTFAFASVVAHQYSNKPLVVIGAYGLATSVSLSRIGGLNHFPSDVLIGAAVGELIGRYVLHRHKDELR